MGRKVKGNRMTLMNARVVNAFAVVMVPDQGVDYGMSMRRYKQESCILIRAHVAQLVELFVQR